MKKIIILFVFSIVLSDSFESDYIALRNDAIGHYDLFLNKINPYRQSIQSIGAIKMNPVMNNQPMSSIVPNLSFIRAVDSSKVISQFMYNRGDYAYRETDILVRNSVTENGNLLFNLHGRKNPIYYDTEIENLDEYVLQNFLVDYTNEISDDQKKQFFRFSKHYHKKNAKNLIDFSNETIELNSVGLEYSIDYLLHYFAFNYSNIFYAIDEGESTLDSQLDYANLSYSYKKWDSFRPFIQLNYSNYLLSQKKSFYDIQLGFAINHVLFKKFEQEFEIAIKTDRLIDGEQVSSLLFDYLVKYKRFTFQLKSYENNCSILSERLNDGGSSLLFYNEGYFLKSLKWMENDFSIELSHYDVDLENAENENGDLLGLEFNYNRGYIDSVTPSSHQKDVLGVGGSYFQYTYGPIKEYLSFNLDLTFNAFIESLFKIDINKYVLYAKGVYSSMNHISTDYGFVDFELGLIFKNFNVSYKFINNEVESYQNSNNLTPPYAMKYLNIIWKFDN